MVSRRHGQWKCGSYPRLPEGLTPHSQTDDKRRPGSPCYTTASTAVWHITSAAGGGQEVSSRGTVGAAALLPRTECGICTLYICGICTCGTQSAPQAALITREYITAVVVVGYTCRASKLRSQETRSESVSGKQLRGQKLTITSNCSEEKVQTICIYRSF